MTVREKKRMAAAWLARSSRSPLFTRLEYRLQPAVSKRLTISVIRRKELEEAMVEFTDQCLFHVLWGITRRRRRLLAAGCD